MEFSPQRGAFIGQDRNREQTSVLRTGSSNGEGRDGDAAGHLHNGKQRIHALKRLALNRDAEDGNRGVSGGHTWEVCSATGSGDDDFETATFSGFGEFGEQVGRAVGGDNSALVGYTEVSEDFRGGTHRFPVRLAAHDDGNEWRERSRRLRLRGRSNGDFRAHFCGGVKPL